MPSSERAEVGRKIVIARPRIPVVSGPRLLEMAGMERVLALLEAPNAVPVRVRKTKAIAAIQLVAYGDDTRLRPRCGNPQALSHTGETDENPRGVWTLKKLGPGPSLTRSRRRGSTA
jgi:hypothetical protein